MILSISIVSPPLYYSKFDIVNLFDPPNIKLTIRFIKALLEKRKWVILLNLSDCSIFRQLQTIKLDGYNPEEQEMSTKNMWGFVKQISYFLSYFSRSWSEWITWQRFYEVYTHKVKRRRSQEINSWCKEK